MKISELIERLEKIKKDFGDIKVYNFIETHDTKYLNYINSVSVHCEDECVLIQAK